MVNAQDKAPADNSSWRLSVYYVATNADLNSFQIFLSKVSDSAVQ